MAITKIISKNTATPNKRPGIADIDLGEIAINTYDGKMFIKKNQDGVIEVVQVGDDPTPNVFYVSKSGKPGNLGTSLSDAFKTIDSAVSLITTLQEFEFDEAICRRDLGLILDGLQWDIAFGTNYNAVTSGLAYQRGSVSAIKVIAEQQVATRSAFNEAKGAIASIDAVKNSTGYDGAFARNNRHWAEVVDILVNGQVSTEVSADTILYPEPPVLPTPDANDASAILQNNREWLKTEIVEYISDNYPGLEYDSVRCRRDVGFITDGLTFDVLYGGTFATNINTRAYFSFGNNQLGDSASDPEVIATVATYGHLKQIVGEIIQGSLTSNLASGADTSGNGGQYATSTEASVTDSLLDIIINTISAGSLSGLSPAVNPILTSRGVSNELRDAIQAINDERNLIVTQSVQRANATNDITIYLKSGDYVINNPIQLPEKVAIVGDNLRTTTVRPRNVDSDLFYVRSGCFLKDITFRDHQSGAACVAFNPNVDSPRAGPFIIQSPYVQNCTSITTDGVGMKIDGSKAWGLRSMVSDAFTQYNAAGIGTYLLNRGYAQLVSIFTISTATSILAETGGQCSITNSNSSFGDFGLVARGSSPVLYSGILDSDQFKFDDVIQVNEITNLDSADWLNDYGAYKKPNYGDAMRLDSENYFYTVLGIDSIGPGSYNVTFQPPLNQDFRRNQTVAFRQRSVITSSSHTFEYVGAGTNTFTAIPQNGGIPDATKEVIFDSETNEGLVVFTSTDQLGDFRIGADLTIRRQAGRIEGETFERSLYAILTPYILALEG
jgi:hypothetical protein